MQFAPAPTEADIIICRTEAVPKSSAMSARSDTADSIDSTRDTAASSEPASERGTEPQIPLVPPALADTTLSCLFQNTVASVDSFRSAQVLTAVHCCFHAHCCFHVHIGQQRCCGNGSNNNSERLQMFSLQRLSPQGPSYAPISSKFRFAALQQNWASLWFAHLRILTTSSL